VPGGLWGSAALTAIDDERRVEYEGWVRRVVPRGLSGEPGPDDLQRHTTSRVRGMALRWAEDGKVE